MKPSGTHFVYVLISFKQPDDGGGIGSQLVGPAIGAGAMLALVVVFQVFRQEYRNSEADKHVFQFQNW